jgi:hypothetical protein
VHSDITFFTSFKAIGDPVDDIGQHSAAYSWKREKLTANPVLAIGRDDGVEDFCRKHHFRYIPDVKLARDRGLVTTHPMLRSLFEMAVAHTTTTYMCLINSDIIVSPGFHSRLGTLLFKNKNPFVVGIRYDIALGKPVIDDKAYMALWKRTDIKLHQGGGSDYFAFTKQFARQMLTYMPDYVMGAAAWDNWLHWVGLNRSQTPICTIKNPKILHPRHSYRQLLAPVKKNIYEHPAVKHNLKIYKSNRQKAGATGGGWKRS